MLASVSESSRTVVLRPERGYPFHVLAKCYTPTGGVYSPNGQTLLLLHSTSFHKEVYEPTLDDLLLMIKHNSGSAICDVKINEMWVIECPNHGESAVYNQHLLRLPEYENFFSCESYAAAARHFLTAKDASGRSYIRTKPENIIGVGHSLGGVAMIFLAAVVQFASLVIADPFLFPGDPADLLALRHRLVNSAHERRDVWPSREEARKALKACKWDSRVLELYVRYAVREHPTWTNSSMPYRGYTLACTRDQEATMYRDRDGATKSLVYLDRICATTPVNIIFGNVPDVIPRYVQDNIVKSRYFASITWLDGVGHLVPQCAPQGLAKVLYTVLEHEASAACRPRL